VILCAGRGKDACHTLRPLPHTRKSFSALPVAVLFKNVSVKHDALMVESAEVDVMDRYDMTTGVWL
jgi:hypothetical protein